MQTNTITEDRYIELYEGNIDKVENVSPAILNSFRAPALNKFRSLGIPSKKNEKYRYTNLEPYFNYDYKSYFMPDESDFIKAEEFRCDVTELDAHGIVLLNGFYPTINGKLVELPGGIIIGSLNEAARRFPSLMEEHYDNCIWQQDGLIHRILPDGFSSMFEGVSSVKPVQVVNS